MCGERRRVEGGGGLVGGAEQGSGTQCGATALLGCGAHQGRDVCGCRSVLAALSAVIEYDVHREKERGDEGELTAVGSGQEQVAEHRAVAPLDAARRGLSPPHAQTVPPNHCIDRVTRRWFALA